MVNRQAGSCVPKSIFFTPLSENPEAAIPAATSAILKRLYSWRILCSWVPMAWLMRDNADREQRARQSLPEWQN
jgi:hypothetical protein